jgi:DNA-binding NarL/FixJ family response regulator
VSQPIHVLVVDDQDLIRGGICSILAAEPSVDVVGEACDGPAGVRLAQQLMPDVVLMDIEMPGGDGLAATHGILTHCPNTRVLILTMFDLDEYVFEAMQSGAAGFLLKTTPPAELTRAVLACAHGETPLAPTVLRRMIDQFVQRRPSPPSGIPAELTGLTPRELDVLRALARGLSNAEIGRTLFMSEATVKTHVTRILAKLHLRDRVQAVVMAYESGLVINRTRS